MLRGKGITPKNFTDTASPEQIHDKKLIIFLVISQFLGAPG